MQRVLIFVLIATLAACGVKRNLVQPNGQIPPQQPVVTGL
jgi:predicted small lipoprotein YifL